MEFRQFYFGSLHDDINTLFREWPHGHFGLALVAEIAPRKTVTEAAGSAKFVEALAFRVDFSAGPSGSAVPPFNLGCQAY